MNSKQMWTYLIHLSTNMWYDRPPSAYKSDYVKIRGLSPKLLCDERSWRQMTEQLAWIGANTLLIDVGDGVVFPSHPELAIEGSWSPDRLLAEVKRLKAMGIEALPKLNFSTTHDSWLKEYHRQVSTPEYYRVCEDLIRDVAEIFGHPRYLHLGMDEERPGFGVFSEFAVFRQGDLWWNDFRKLVGWTERYGMRPITWSSTMRNNPDYATRTPKSVVICVGDSSYTRIPIDAKRPCLDFAEDVAKKGFDVMALGSNWQCDENFRDISAWALAHIPAERLSGFLMAPWVRTLPQFARQAQRAVNHLEDAMLLAGAKQAPGNLRCAFAAWFLKPGAKEAHQTKYPEDRMRLAADEELVLDFGVGAERPVIDTRMVVPGTLTLRTANVLDGQRPVCLPGQAQVTFQPREDRSEPATPLTPGRYLVISADRSTNFTKIAVRT